MDIVKPDGHTDELIVLSNGVQKDIQIKDLKEANTSLRGSNSLADTARDPKTGKGMATGHVPVKKELGHVKEDFRGPLTHSNERLG